MNESLGYESDPSHILTLASSIAQRNVQEHQWQQSVLAETVPLSTQLPLEVAQNIQTGATVAMLELLENPDSTIDPVALARTIIDDSALGDAIRSTNEEPDEESVSLLRTLVDQQIKTLWEHFAGDKNAQKKLKGLLEVAEAVASEHSVAAYEVFASDDLYGECIRLLNTPETYAEEATAAIEKLNHELIYTTFESTVEALLQADLANGEITPEEYAIEKNEIMQELLEDEEMQTDLNASISAFRHASQRLISRGIERFWGKQALDASATLLGQLATELSLSSDITLSGSLLEQQQYNDIVATLCIENEWDPNRLTVAQMRYINSSPQVQEFQDKD